MGQITQTTEERTNRQVNSIYDDMKQIGEIKAMIREMMDQEMENFKEAVGDGDADETASPVVYTTLQVLMAKIEAMPKVWHSASEDVGNNESILVLNEEGKGCTTTRERLVRGYGEWGKGFCQWAYTKDILPEIKEG